jgi:hypothetical protein
MFKEVKNIRNDICENGNNNKDKLFKRTTRMMKKTKTNQALEAHACNSSYLRG